MELLRRHLLILRHRHDGQVRVPLGAAGSDAAMKTQANYAGWDFTTVWQMGGRGYRVLP
ncbi:MAG: hypothetical protein IPG50_26760 [Myxococcales bacterium]|nr:hypothetical protein [Myxococcales bacterium]